MVILLPSTKKLRVSESVMFYVCVVAKIGDRKEQVGATLKAKVCHQVGNVIMG